MVHRFGAITPIAAACALAWLSGCPKGTSVEAPHSKDAAKDRPLPPAVPAEVEVVKVEPRAGHDASARSPLLAIMAEENARWMDTLRAHPEVPAHYISYQVVERRTVVIEAEGGGLVTDEDQTVRTLDAEVRAGSPEIDNTRPLRDTTAMQLAEVARIGKIPFGDDPVAIRHHLWLETDRRYREARDLLALVLHEQRLASSKRENVPDFTHEKGEVFIERPAPLQFDHGAWSRRIRDCSKRAARGVATRSACQAVFEQVTSYFVNSDGAKLQTSGTSARLSVTVGVKADDGMPLSRLEQRFAPTPAELPDDAELERIITTVTADLDGLHKAPVVDPYIGPAILEGRAAAVFFHEVFGHRVEGHRQKDERSDQTFTEKIGKKIMPEWLTVYDDPRIQRLNQIPLNGFYRFDDEGVAARRAVLVDKGVFAGFLQSRNPLPNFPRSTGHGRKEPGNLPIVSRQGNLVVETERSVTEEELIDELVAEINRQGKPYGLLFTDISGGFTFTQRFMPQAFKVNPVMAYRVYPDRRRELVRGVDIVGLPLHAFESIISAARPIQTFNGMCGAESGWVPVSASAPSLLLDRLEVQRGFQPTDNPPVLPAPSIERTR